MTIFVDPCDQRSLSAQVYDQIRGAIEEGRFKPGDRLPSSRAIAADLRVARSTITSAYERLGAEGFLDGRAGAGSFVSAFRVRPGPQDADGALVPHERLQTLNPFLQGSDHGGRYEMRPGHTDRSRFPDAAWRGCVRAAAARRDTGYRDPAGDETLRTVLARWIGQSRGVIARPDQVVITHGTGQAIDMLARVLLAPGDVACVEEPGYPPVTNLLRTLGVRVVGAPVNSDGIVVDAIPDSARVVYVTPSHQFPLGMVMSRSRRRQLMSGHARAGRRCAGPRRWRRGSGWSTRRRR